MPLPPSAGGSLVPASAPLGTAGAPALGAPDAPPLGAAGVDPAVGVAADPALGVAAGRPPAAAGAPAPAGVISARAPAAAAPIAGSSWDGEAGASDPHATKVTENMNTAKLFMGSLALLRAARGLGRPGRIPYRDVGERPARREQTRGFIWATARLVPRARGCARSRACGQLLWAAA